MQETRGLLTEKTEELRQAQLSFQLEKESHKKDLEHERELGTKKAQSLQETIDSLESGLQKANEEQARAGQELKSHASEISQLKETLKEKEVRWLISSLLAPSLPPLIP